MHTARSSQVMYLVSSMRTSPQDVRHQRVAGGALDAILVVVDYCRLRRRRRTARRRGASGRSSNARSRTCRPARAGAATRGSTSGGRTIATACRRRASPRAPRPGAIRRWELEDLVPEHPVDVVVFGARPCGWLEARISTRVRTARRMLAVLRAGGAGAVEGRWRTKNRINTANIVAASAGTAMARHDARPRSPRVTARPYQVGRGKSK